MKPKKNDTRTASFDFDMADSSQPRTPDTGPSVSWLWDQKQLTQQVKEIPPSFPDPKWERPRLNEQALRIARLCEITKRLPGSAGREALKRFTGTGGIITSQESLGQYLTPYEICRLLTDLVRVQSGTKVFDPTCGTGRMAEFLPAECAFTGIEIDNDAARIAKLLYPQHNIECADIRNNLSFREDFDLVMGNPPFGLWWEVDPEKSNVASRAGKVLSQWKILELSMQSVKRGGIIGLVVPKNTFENDRAGDIRAADFWTANCLVRAMINLDRGAFAESGTTWPCSIIIIQRPPAEPAEPFAFTFTDTGDIRQHEDCIARFRTSQAFKEMITASGTLLKDRKTRTKTAHINTAHAEAKKEFEYVYSGALKTDTKEDIVFVKRAGHLFRLKPNGLIAALKLEEWKSNMDGYSRNLWQQHCTVDHIVFRDNIKGFAEAGLTIQLDPDLERYMKTKRAFYFKENLAMNAVPTEKQNQYERGLEKLKELGIWDLLAPFQRHDAVVHSIKNYSFLGYDMRLGKTRTSIAAALLKGTKKNLYVCYSRLIEVWYREMLKMGIAKSDIKVIQKVSDLDKLRTHNIISFEKLRDQERENQPVECEICGAIVTGKTCTAPNPSKVYSHDRENKLCGWHRYRDATCPNCKSADDYTGRYCKKCGHANENFFPGIYKRMRKLFSLIVVDESQASKNKNSLQGQALRTLKAKHKMILTGTILENYVSEAFWQLWWLLGASCRFPYPFDGGHTMFTNRFCEFTTTKSGRKKMLPKIINENPFYQMFDSIMTRRTEEDQQVKEVFRISPVEEFKTPVQPTKQEVTLYNKALENFEEWYMEQLVNLDETPSWMRGDSKKQLSAAVLVKLNALRKLSSCPFTFEGFTGKTTAKIEVIKKLVESKMEKGEKVLISSAYKALVNRLIEELPSCAGFTGEMPINKRNKIMDTFKEKESFSNLIVTTQCCNLGVDLSTANTAIITDFLWSPKQLKQMWSRIRGVNQQKKCEVIYLINQGFIDVDMNQLTIDKDKAIDKAIDRIESSDDIVMFSPIDFANRMIARSGRAWIQKYLGKEF